MAGRERADANRKLPWSLIAAVTFGVVAYAFVRSLHGPGVFAVSVDATPPPPDAIEGSDLFFPYLPPAGVLAATVLGGLLWPLVGRDLQVSWVLRGGLVGFLAGSLGHPVAWSISPLLAGNLDGVVGYPLMSVYSLAFLGLFTIPLASLVGLGLGVARQVAD